MRRCLRILPSPGSLSWPQAAPLVGPVRRTLPPRVTAWSRDAAPDSVRLHRRLLSRRRSTARRFARSWPARFGSARSWILGLALLLAGCGAAKRPATFGVYAIWLAGHGDEDRAELDRFLTCLIDGSTLNAFWEGEARLVRRGSWTVPAPDGPLDWSDAATWLAPHLAAGRVPGPRADETPVYLVFGGSPALKVAACGRNAAGEVAGRRAGLAIVRNHPLCWPTGDRVRTETQVATHELVETVDRLLGYEGCAGGGACRGKPVCPRFCDTFVGLACPGAPTGTWTGCESGKVDGWVIQRFSHASRAPGTCGQCATCDFTPRACAPGEARCGSAAWDDL